jgi:polysaccharide export outer membrane protein
MLGRLMLLFAVVAAMVVSVLAPTAYAQGAAVAAPPPAATPPAAPSLAAPAGSAAAPRAGLQYRLGAGDKIRVIVYGEQTLSGEFFVNDTGKVSLPLIGEVQASGLTVQAFQSEIETAFRTGYLRDPRVSAEVLTYRPYYILGEVNKPGEYPYSNGLNVLNAVATAGGFTYRAQTKRVFIRRTGETRERPYNLTSDVAVAPGDTIRITERFF